VLQYRSRNKRFPHESTADQFYDEAQWESYRRLGEHAAGATLRFLDSMTERSNFVDSLFMEARQHLQRAPDHQRDDFLELTQRCASIESGIMSDAPAKIRAEMFPEVAALHDIAPPAPGPDDELKTVFWMMQIAQVMEDVWVGAELDLYWSHPLNEGWMNYFHRWASTPSFRKWWPLLRPMYSVGFRDFVRERFDLRIRDDEARTEPKGAPGAQLTLSAFDPAKRKDGHAWTEWQRGGGAASPAKEMHYLSYDMCLDGQKKALQVGVLGYEETQKNEKGQATVAEWSSTWLFVPAPLMGGGIIARFLDRVLVDLKNKGFQKLRVRLPSENRRDPASRNERVKEIAFYKSRGFAYASSTVLELELQHPAPAAPAKKADAAPVPV
jgi:hypothetical protein